jgi:hypothetical protein
MRQTKVFHGWTIPRNGEKSVEDQCNTMLVQMKNWELVSSVTTTVVVETQADRNCPTTTIPTNLLYSTMTVVLEEKPKMGF